jgi:hypothetical protein
MGCLYKRPFVRVAIVWSLGVVLVGVGKSLTSFDNVVAADIAEEKQDTAGNPLTTWLVEQAVREVKEGLKARNIEGNFSTFQSYAGEVLDTTAGQTWRSELTGNCRLRWYDRMMRNSLQAAVEAEQFTRQLHEALREDHKGLDRALAMAREKMDLGSRSSRTFSKVISPEQALETLKKAIADATTSYKAAFSPLSPDEVTWLSQYLYPVLTGQCVIGHALGDPGNGRRLCDLLEKMNRGAMFDAADALAALSDPQILAQLAKLPEKGDVGVPGVTGTVVQKIATPAGTIIIGGRGKNVYDLDQMTDVCAVVDLGGDDVYHEGTVSPQRPLLILIDLAGNDRYEGTKPGIQGGAVLGISLLIDAAGDDTYQAMDVAQGSALGGVGILIDMAGNDHYRGLRRVQGQAMGGIGLLLDRTGKDDYHAAMWAQGFGGPLGFGVLDDVAGDDHYYCGGTWRDSYPETPGYEGWGQGVGAGIRQVANGGIGVLLEGAGDDVYEYDYFAHGGGYWLGMGFARDFGGNDRRLGPTETAYDGRPRAETRYNRFNCGFGCHYAIGFCFDDAGDDTYGGTIMGLGFAWDCSTGMLFDFGGNDRYEATGGHTQGNGAQAGLGILFDYGGDDTYGGYSQGYASPSISYHTLPRCGGNFSFLIDYGGHDTYGCGEQDNSYTQRGAAGGFLIDRPFHGESDSKASESPTTDDPTRVP